MYGILTPLKHFRAPRIVTPCLAMLLPYIHLRHNKPLLYVHTFCVTCDAGTSDCSNLCPIQHRARQTLARLQADVFEEIVSNPERSLFDKVELNIRKDRGAAS
jgi:hypothetical protein